MLSILKYPDPRLRRVCEPVETIDEGLAALMTMMVNVMKNDGGIGLAAPQVGFNKRIIVATVDGTDFKIINPVIMAQERNIVFRESCLSLPGLFADVHRSEEVYVKGLDEDGKDLSIIADSLLAVVLQHEIEHLDGKLLIDHVSILKRDMYTKKVMKAQRKFLLHRKRK